MNFRFFLTIKFFIFSLFLNSSKIISKDSIMFTCNYKRTEYIDHKLYGNESHFLDEYSKEIGWISINENDVKISGIGWSQNMKFSSVEIKLDFIEIKFKNIFNEKIMKESRILINRESGELREDFYSKSNDKSEKFNIYVCKI